MPELYFNKFPRITYANTNCIDITARVTIEQDLRRSPVVFDDYTLKNSTRSDSIAAKYYDDPNMEWMIWLSNGIIDPYYGWNLSPEDFEAHIVKKYGSIAKATQKIAYYKNNYAADDTELTPSFYNNSLPKNLKKYYNPNYNENVTILSYSRKKDDTIVNTNKLYQFNITLSNTTNFVVGEFVNLTPGDGKGEVVFANSTIVNIKNISGFMTGTNIKGSDTNANATVTGSTKLAENIADDEAVYWSPVYYYDLEHDLNEKNATIQLVNPAYASEIAYKMRTVFKS